jgi:sugar (pentulose or hexulose) kinase
MVTRISQGTTREELFTAYIRSIAFALRHVFDSMESISSSAAMKLTGGMARSQSWCELLSNVLCKKVEVLKDGISVAQKGLYNLYLLGKGTKMPSIEIEKTYNPSNYCSFEALYEEYKFYANRLLQNQERVPTYLDQ